MKAVTVAAIALVMISLMGSLMVYRVNQLEHQVATLQTENAALSAATRISAKP